MADLLSSRSGICRDRKSPRLLDRPKEGPKKNLKPVGNALPADGSLPEKRCGNISSAREGSQTNSGAVIVCRFSSGFKRLPRGIGNSDCEWPGISLQFE